MSIGPLRSLEGQLATAFITSSTPAICASWSSLDIHTSILDLARPQFPRPLFPFMPPPLNQGDIQCILAPDPIEPSLMQFQPQRLPPPRHIYEYDRKPWESKSPYPHILRGIKKQMANLLYHRGQTTLFSTVNCRVDAQSYTDRENSGSATIGSVPT